MGNSEPVRASSEWLTMRESADAAARATELVEEIGPYLATDGGTEIHDFGCGTGSMARWLAPQLTGPQHWVLYDRDAELLTQVVVDPPDEASDGAPVTVETRQRDITRLDPGELTGASLITASALLDMMTAEELQRLIATCARAGCAVLITLTVTGRVDLTPADPLDQRVTEAFNAHQRRSTGVGRRLGPGAVGAALDGFTRLGLDVVVRPSHGGSALTKASWRRSGSPVGWPRHASNDPNWAPLRPCTLDDAWPRQPQAGCPSLCTTRTC